MHSFMTNRRKTIRIIKMQTTVVQTTISRKLLLLVNGVRRFLNRVFPRFLHKDLGIFPGRVGVTSGSGLGPAAPVSLSLAGLLEPAGQHVGHPLHQRHVGALLAW